MIKRFRLLMGICGLVAVLTACGGHILIAFQAHRLHQPQKRAVAVAAHHESTHRRKALIGGEAVLQIGTHPVTEQGVGCV